LQRAKEIPTGLTLAKFYSLQKDKILLHFNATEKDWEDWHWQIRHRISDVDTLSTIFPLSEKHKQEIADVGRTYRWAISPYYLSLIDFKKTDDPIFLQ